MIDPLSAHERALLEQLRASAPPSIARRAHIILLSESGSADAVIAAQLQISKQTAGRWRRAWREVRLGVFPAETLEARAEQPAEAAAPAPRDEPSGPDAPDAPDAPPPGVTAPRLPLELREAVDLQPDDSLAEAGRKVLRYHFERMLLHEPGTRLGTDIEALHDMRVATRRMRSAFRLFRPAYAPDAIRPFGKELRKIAGALGVVRDLDVALDKLQGYASDHPQVDLGPLRSLWEDRRSEGRAALFDELDSKRFARFVRRFDRFLRTPGAGVEPDPADDGPVPHQVRHAALPLIATHYAQVRAYEPVVEGAPIATLHALRIEFKRLRYTLEFFEEVLGPEAKRVIKIIKRMQDHLGDLHDADVAAIDLSAILDQHEAAYSGTPSYARPDLSGVYDYLAFQLSERQRLIDAFPEAWAGFLSEDVRRDLALAVAAL